jgi:HAD superfamily hydrolase (TIGR01509 family)
MVKAIIFDCFGVLTTEGWQEFKETYFSDPDKLEEANKLNYLADQGKMNHEELLPLIAEIAQIPVSQAREEIDDYRPNKSLLEYIKKELKPNYKIGMLSNVSDDWIVKMFTPDQVKLFDNLALSFNIGHTKPEPEAYEYATRKLEVELSECVFIDDRLHFVEAARELGMQGIEYKDFKQMKNELEQILEMTNTDK